MKWYQLVYARILSNIAKPIEKYESCSKSDRYVCTVPKKGHSVPVNVEYFLRLLKLGSMWEKNNCTIVMLPEIGAGNAGGRAGGEWGVCVKCWVSLSFLLVTFSCKIPEPGPEYTWTKHEEAVYLTVKLLWIFTILMEM